jgi:hypothetical protein
MRLTRIFCFVLAGIVVVPAVSFSADQASGHKTFRKAQREKMQAFHKDLQDQNQDFRQSLKGKDPHDKNDAIKNHLEEQAAKRKEFQAKRFEENKAFLMNRLSKNDQMTTGQKEELINLFEERHAEQAAFHQERHKENIEFFEKIANDSSLTMEQKKQAIKAHRDAEQSENKEDRQERHEKLSAK